MPVLVISASLALTACGPGAGDGKAAEQVVAKLPTAEALLAKAKSAFHAAPATRIVGTVDDGTDPLVIDIVGDAKGNGTGTMAIGPGKGKARIISIRPRAWILGDVRFWRTNGAGADSSMMARQWVEVSVKRGDAKLLADILDRESFVKDVFAVGGDAIVSEGPDGATWELGDDGTGRLVLDKTTGRPLAMKAEADDEGIDVRFSYPAAATVAPPAADSVLKVD